MTTSGRAGTDRPVKSRYDNDDDEITIGCIPSTRMKPWFFTFHGSEHYSFTL